VYRRKIVNFLLAPAAIDRIDEIAAETDTNRSEVIRMCLKIAMGDKANLIRRLTAMKEQM
jgi:hypothetical protein